MNEILSGEINRLERSFANIESKKPFLKPVVDAFREVIIKRAILRSNISERLEVCVPPPQPDMFLHGQPLLTEITIAALIDPWGETIKSAISPLIKDFPSISADILKVRDYAENGKIDLKNCICDLMEDVEENIIKTAADLSMDPVVFKFILLQIIKPFVEKRTEGLRVLINESGIKTSFAANYINLCV
jgi:hypothetical protein